MKISIALANVKTVSGGNKAVSTTWHTHSQPTNVWKTTSWVMKVNGCYLFNFITTCPLHQLSQHKQRSEACSPATQGPYTHTSNYLASYYKG